MKKRRKNRSGLATVIMTPLLDLLLLPLVLPAALILKSIRRMGLHRLRLCRMTLIRVGVLPLKKHYYEPFIDARDLRFPLELERSLPGIDWNIPEQLALLDTLRHEDELQQVATTERGKAPFFVDNGTFERGDAEFLYQIIRAKMPRRLVEIGSGNSTVIAGEALLRNGGGEHTCIEPFEAPWLETLGPTVIRQKVEEVDKKIFHELAAGDILFIDSSHVIRPQGDVLTEYLEILPILKPGVIVHIHDILSPRDYHKGWLLERMWLWNEQYLLEAFLTHNRNWKIIAALNLLKHHHFDALKRVCPFLTASCEPQSFYIQRVE